MAAIFQVINIGAGFIYDVIFRSLSSDPTCSERPHDVDFNLQSRMPNPYSNYPKNLLTRLF